MKNLPTYEEFLNERKRTLVFDFDDTIGITDNPVGIIRIIDGQGLEDIESILKDYGVNSKDGAR